MPQYGLYDDGTGKMRNSGKERNSGAHLNRHNTAGSTADKPGALSGLKPGIQGPGKFQGVSQNPLEARFGTEYRNILNDEERLKRMKTPGTELYRKEKNASAIESSEKRHAEMRKARALAIAARTGIRMYHPTLQTISRFMTGNDKEDLLLLMEFNSRKGANRARSLIRMIRRFMKINPESLSITGEKQIADNSDKLEDLSEKFFALQYLITVSPETYNGLNAQLKDRFERQYTKAQRIVTYYRLKKRVMTNEYYKTHQNDEIGRKTGEKNTGEQKLLSELIWQSEDGLNLFLRDTASRVCDETVKKLVRAMHIEKAAGDMRKLREKLALRQEIIRRIELKTHNGKKLSKEDDTGTTEKPGPAGYAFNIEKLELTGDPAKDIGGITKLMDQLDALEKLSGFRKVNPDSYYLKQSDRQIRICEAALGAKGVLRRMFEDLILLEKKRSEGTSGSPGKRGNAVTGLMKRYLEDLKEYNSVMDSFEEAEKWEFDPGMASDPFNKDFHGIKKTPELEEGARKLILDLAYAEDSFSDRDIYRYMDEIILYSVKLAGTSEGEIFASLADRAKVLRKEKRYLNLKELKEKGPLRTDIEEELRLLESEHNSRSGPGDGQPALSGTDRTLEYVMALRNKAGEIRPEFNDVKARTSYYMDQYEWLAGAKPGLYPEQAYGTDSALFQTGKHICSTYRTGKYGRESYEWVKPDLNRFPGEFRHMEENTPIFLQRGDADVVPPVEITKYFIDRDKLDIAGIHKELCSRLEGAERSRTDLFSHPERLAQAIGTYSMTGCAVTEESIQMELAALDTFQSEALEYFRQKGGIDTQDDVTLMIISVMEKLDSFIRGSLRSEMTDEEYAQAMKQTPVHTGRTGDGFWESNIEDLPLFTHRPNINDIRQGMGADSHILAALQTMAASDPEAIQRMFYDPGDGTVLVRLYAGYDVLNRRIDNFEDVIKENCILRPLYVRVRKDYETEACYPSGCIWAQLLEKAVAAAGIMHGISKTDENGRIGNFRNETGAGFAARDITYFTGIKTEKETNLQILREYVLPDNLMQRERMRMLLYGVPLFLQQDIRPGITSKFGRGKEEDDSAEAFFKALETELRTQRDKYREKTDLFIRSLTGDGLLDEEDAGELKTAIMKVYDYSPEELLEKVKANIENDSTERDNGLDYEKPDTLFPKIRSALPYGEDIGKEDILDLIRQKKEYYTSLMKEDEKPGDYRRRMQETDKVTIRLNKAMLETDPNERYNIRQMSMLHDIRRSVRAGKAVACSTDTNVLSVLDVRLYNGRWFLLVRDPHNIDSIEYTKGQDGEINSRRYLRDPGEKLLWYDRGRHWDGTVLSAVLGTSWWELKDFDKEIGSYLIGPERK